MKILIAGAGAVGSLIGAKLSLSGEKVAVFHPREDFCRVINERGIHVTEPHQTRRASASAYADWGKLFQAEGSFSLAIIAVKSYSTRDLMQALTPYLDRIEHFLCVQNGLGNEEILMEFVKTGQITAGSLTIACSSHGAGEVEVENKGGLALSSLSSISAAPIGSLFRSAGFDVKEISNWEAMKWSKALLNMIGNATCALLDMSGADVFSNRALFRLERKALLEAVRVMEACRLSPVALPSYPVPRFVWALKHLPEAFLFPIFKRKAGRGRGEKLASFHRDFLRGKFQTEAEFLYGAIARRGNEQGIRTPILSKLNELLTGVASGKISWETYRHKPDTLTNEIRDRKLGTQKN